MGRTIREVTFKGSPFERGLARGKRLRRTLEVLALLGTGLLGLIPAFRKRRKKNQ